MPIIVISAPNSFTGRNLEIKSTEIIRKTARIICQKLSFKRGKNWYPYPAGGNSPGPGGTEFAELIKTNECFETLGSATAPTGGHRVGLRTDRRNWKTYGCPLNARISQRGSIMFSWPMFLLDARPYLLLKARKNSSIIFLYARIRNKGL